MSDYYVKNLKEDIVLIREITERLDNLDFNNKRVEDIDTIYLFEEGKIVLSGNPEDESFLQIYPNSNLYINREKGKEEHRILLEKIQSFNFVLEEI